MKSEKPVSLQPKWICFAAVGALTLGVIVGARAQSNNTALPSPPKLAQAASLDNFDDGPPPPRFEDGGRGPGGPPRDGRPPMGPPPGDDMRPPRPNGRQPHFGDGPDEFEPPRGPRPAPGGPRFESENPQQEALMVLNRCFRTAGHASASAKMTGSASTLFNRAHSTYDAALQAYSAKQFQKALGLADASEHLSRAALELSLPDVPSGPAGWNAPPKAATPDDGEEEQHVAFDLNRVYRDLSRDGASSKNPDELITLAQNFYKEASKQYNAKQFGAARRGARAADEVIRAARRLSDTSST